MERGVERGKAKCSAESQQVYANYFSMLAFIFTTDINVFCPETCMRFSLNIFPLTKSFLIFLLERKSVIQIVKGRGSILDVYPLYLFYHLLMLLLFFGWQTLQNKHRFVFLYESFHNKDVTYTHSATVVMPSST